MHEMSKRREDKKNLEVIDVAMVLHHDKNKSILMQRYQDMYNCGKLVHIACFCYKTKNGSLKMQITPNRMMITHLQWNMECIWKSMCK